MTNKNTRNFTPSDDALICSNRSLSSASRHWQMIRTSQEVLIRRADELGVSLISDDRDEALDTRALRRSEKLVDPLLERLKQIHGDQK
ncbi:MAG TPA: hypothetical protein VI137_04965 [Pseudolabrys sp.]|jgi:2-phosphoglycerate kinase